MALILIVDDSPLIRSIIAAALAQIGLVTEEADSCAAARARCCQGDIAALIIDLELPDGNGLEVCAALRSCQATAALPVLLVSGHAQATLEDAAAPLAPCGWLSKPFTLHEIQAAVSALLPRERTHGAGTLH